MRMSRSILTTHAFVLMTVLLASCGGGGGGGSDHDLTVSFGYPNSMAQLWRASTLSISATGLEGHAPSCSLVSGALPAGLTLNADGCAITGTPTEAKIVNVTIRLTVPGFTGQVDELVHIQTYGPAINYAFSLSDRRGTPISAMPISDAVGVVGAQPWTAQSGESVVYSVASGALPDGLTLNPSTGELSGITSHTANYRFMIAATAQGPLGTATVQESVAHVYAVVDEGLLIFYGPNDAPVSTSVGAAVSLHPLVSYGFYLNAADYTYTNYRLSPTSAPLPPGLNLDSVTGLMAGTPQAAGHTQITVLVDVSAKGQRATFTSDPLDLTVN